MSDIRLQRMAHVLVNYSLNIKKGDRLAIRTSPLATPLLQEVVREAVQSTWPWEPVFPKRLVSISQPCTGIWSAIYAPAAKFVLMGNCSAKMGNL